MSTNNLNETHQKINHNLSIGMICEKHHALKKYFLVKEKKFICEYDTYDSVNDKIIHFQEYLEKNNDKFPLIQSQGHRNLTSRGKEFAILICDTLNKLSKDSSMLIKESENLKENLVNKINFSSKNKDLELAKHIITQEHLDEKGNLDAKKIGRNPEKESLLVSLCQIINNNNQKNMEEINDLKPFTALLTNNIEEIQHDSLKLINDLYELVERVYDSLLPDVAASESQIPNLKDRNYLKDKYIPQKIHNNKLTSYQNIICEKEKEIESLTKTLQDLRQKNLQYDKKLAESQELNNLIRNNDKLEIERLNGKIECLNDEIANVYKEVDLCKKELNGKREDLDKVMGDFEKQKALDLSKINELDRELLSLNKQLSDVSDIHLNQKKNIEKIHLEELDRMKDYYSKIFDDMNVNAVNDKRKVENHNLQAEINALTKKNNDLLLENMTLREEIPLASYETQKSLEILKKEKDDLLSTKEKLLNHLKQERDAMALLDAENAKLSNIKSELELLVFELREKLEALKVADKKSSNFGKQQENELARSKIQYEKKISTLEDMLKDNQNRFTLKTNSLEKSIADLLNEQREFANIRAQHLERIIELEREIIELRNKLKEKDIEFKEANEYNKYFKNIIEQLKMNNFNATIKNKEHDKFTEEASTDMSSLKENFKKKINHIETELQAEKENLKNYTQAYETKLTKNAIKKTQLKNDNEQLKQEIEFLKGEWEKDKAQNNKKLEDLNAMINELNKNRNSYKAVVEEEKRAQLREIVSLQKDVQKMQNSYKDIPDNSSHLERVKELESILIEEREKFKNIFNENKLLKNAKNNGYDELIKNTESSKLKILKLESELNEMKSKKKQLLFDCEMLNKQLEEKDEILRDALEKNKEAKLNTEMNIQDLNNHSRDVLRKNMQLEHEIKQLQNDIAIFKQMGTYSDHNKIINELTQDKLGLEKLNELYEKELEVVNANNKAIDEEIIRLNDIIKNVKHNNEILRLENDDLKNFQNSYVKLKVDYDEQVGENELLKSKYSGVHNIPSKEIYRLEDLLSQANKQNKDLLGKIKNLENEIVLLKSKIDAQQAILNDDTHRKLKDALEAKGKLENDNKVKKQQLIDNQYEMDQLKNQNREQKIMLENLKQKLSKSENIKPVLVSAPRNANIEDATNSPYHNIDFNLDDVKNELLINTRNWSLFKSWLNGLQNNDNHKIRCNLLFKATRDGFSHKTFKEKCRRITPTLVVVKTSFDKLIGGFTPLRWDYPKIDSHEYVCDGLGKTFLFSVTLGKKYPIINKNFAICNSNSMGPIFGAGSDLEIMDQCNKNFNNFSGIGKSFEYSDNPELFYGGLKFTVKEYEVYEVLL